MGKFEEAFIYPYTQNLCILYVRYVDDLFLIWTGTKQQFETSFQTLMINIHPISFHKIFKKLIDFHDTTVYIKNGRLNTTIFREDSQIDSVTRNVPWTFLPDPHPPSRETSTGLISKNQCFPKS